MRIVKIRCILAASIAALAVGNQVYATPAAGSGLSSQNRWAGLAHRTKNPLFSELQTGRHGLYSVVCWTHNLNIKNLPADLIAKYGGTAWDDQLKNTYLESARNGLGYMDMPGGLTGKFGSRTTAFHYDLYRRYGVRFDVWTEGSPTTAAAIKQGAEVLNPSSKELGRKVAVSVVDPHYVDAQETILTNLGQKMRDKPFRGVYYGKDEPHVRIPEGSPDKWGPYGQQMAKEVLANYGYGKFAAPTPKDPVFDKDPNKPLRWIAYNRWASDKWFETRTRLYKALRAADPRAVYSPADYWFMSGFVPFDYPKLVSCTDMFEIDPYASSAERRRGRGVYNHGFGAKFMSDLTGRRVRVIAQAFNYAGYTMKPDDLREWVSQALRCGASAISYYTMDNPQYTDPDRWKMMLHIAKVVSTMPRIAIPTDPDTAVLYASYTHMSMGSSTGADQIYSTHALVGEMAGSWYKFVADSQLETGERDLTGYKVVYLPIGKYMTSDATAKIETYIRAGGVLICGDAEAFGSDLRGSDTSGIRERILGIRTIGPSKAVKIKLSASFPGVKAGTLLPIFPSEQDNNASTAWTISVSDKAAKVIGVYPDGKPAIISHKLGKGTVITFAANPFAPQVTVENTQWPAVFKALQKHFGCKVDRPIWRFELPDDH